MKRSLTIVLAALLLAGTTFAGGIVTNTNQSAMFTRMGNRAATLGIDAVYYNPAGLTKLGTGFHISVNSQTIGQTRTINSDYALLNNGEYKGEVFAPVFPGVYAVFNLGKLSFSAGFNPVGGGGSANFASGLPSFEYSPSTLVPALSSQGATAYSLATQFDGSSNFFGYQANIAYEINDMISIAIGARYVTAKETYDGYLKDIMLTMGGTQLPASTVMTGVGDSYYAAIPAATAGGDALQAAITGGFLNGSDALADPTSIAGLTALGLYQEGMTNDQAVASFYSVPYRAARSYATADDLLMNQTVQAEKTATGITPIISVNIQPIDMLNIAIKYEHLTKLEFTNKTTFDVNVELDASNNPVTMFPDGAKTRLDMPALLSVGVTLRPIESLLLAGGYTTYFDKDAVWGTEEENRTELLSGNSWDVGLAAEYALSEKFLISAGWSMTQTSETPEYLKDISYGLSTQGVSFGIGWNILPKLQLNLGGQLVAYQDASKTFTKDFGIGDTDITEIYKKTSWLAAVGINYSLSTGE